MKRIAVIGGGRIGEALIGGLVGGGWDRGSVVLAERHEGRAREVANRFGILATSLADAAEGADFIVLAVKPGDVRVVLEKVADVIAYIDKDPVIVSLAAGISTATMENILAAGTPVVRVMPNSPMLVGNGVSAIAPGRYVKSQEVATVREIFGHVGVAVTCPESQIDAVTAVSGSGPAYFFLFVEAMVDAGIELGLPADLARELAVGTVRGAGEMLASGDEPADPRLLRHAVSSPGGTTAAAIRAFESAGLRSAVYEAMGACAERSRRIGAELAH